RRLRIHPPGGLHRRIHREDLHGDGCPAKRDRRPHALLRRQERHAVAGGALRVRLTGGGSAPLPIQMPGRPGSSGGDSSSISSSFSSIAQLLGAAVGVGWWTAAGAAAWALAGLSRYSLSLRRTLLAESAFFTASSSSITPSWTRSISAWSKVCMPRFFDFSMVSLISEKSLRLIWSRMVGVPSSTSTAARRLPSTVLTRRWETKALRLLPRSLSS